MLKLRPFSRKIALILIIALLNQICFPTIAMALTSGPATPEASSFTPAGSSDMVDLSTGDFHYNIPLLDVGGYPLNLSYNAGVTMDEEASWVGLGWSLNPGSITRDLRGLPDDFRGDSITKSQNIKPNVTTSLTLSGGVEVLGLKKMLSSVNANLSVGLSLNNYNGYSLNWGVSPTLQLGGSLGGSLSADVGFSPQQGLSIKPSVGFDLVIKKKKFLSSDFSANFNSRRGLRDYTIGARICGSEKNKKYFNAINSLIGGGSSYDFNATTYTPSSNMPFLNSAATFHGTVGIEVTGLNINLGLEGAQNIQSLAFKKQKQAAFGSMFNQNGNQSDLLDFNRERNELPWKKDMPVLPPAYGTYDLFMATGQGVGGQFRAVRNDIGHFRDAYHYNATSSFNLGVELGVFPNVTKLGVDGIGASGSFSYASDWTDGAPLGAATGYTDWDGKTQYEPVYFREAGEMNITDNTFRNKIGKTQPVRSDIDNVSGAEKLNWKFTSNQRPSGGQSFSTSSTFKRTGREARNMSFQYLTSVEAERYGLEKKINSYSRNILRINQTSYLTPSSTLRSTNPYHHISEATIVKPDGSRYVYGLPAYNRYQKSVTFSVDTSGQSNVRSSGLVKYVNGQNSINNTVGKDNFYDADEMPAYTYAYLLTGVLSADYIDRTGDGISYDDNGTAVRFNYTKLSQLFNWRTPIAKDTAKYTVARYQPGRRSTNLDDKASYIYGQKEIWYVHSIESATMVAQFYTSDRDDALGVWGENGGINTAVRLQKLDSIALFSRSDLVKSGSAAIPIKVVHFKYNYSLCPGVPNQINAGQGKLTLARVWFTYGKTQKGAFNAYNFTYDATMNYAYNLNNIDRWGSYKLAPAQYPSNSEFPYGIQAYDSSDPNDLNANNYAAAWNLSQISLPSGGVISVKYESDSYAYVQNKRAGQMFFVWGFSNDAIGDNPASVSNALYTDKNSPNGYVWVDLGVSAKITSLNQFTAFYLGDVKSLYFNMEVALGDNTDWENVSGYMDLDITANRPLHYKTSGSYMRYIGIPVRLPLKDKLIGNANEPMNPITKAGGQLLRLELPEKVYIGYNASNAFQALVKAFPAVIQSVTQTIKGFENALMDKSCAKLAHVTSNNSGQRSWVRLANPNLNKYGGGHRVKEIRMSDSWDLLSDQNPAVAAQYGQVYTYTTQQKINVGGVETTVTGSSGVAAWEPVFGGEENLWKEPVTYNDQYKLAPDNSFYVEKPFCEGLFPAPTVGYSEVKVQSINGTNPRSGPGWSIYKFYTAREFPTIVDYSDVASSLQKTRGLQKFLNLLVKDYLTLSQGFTIETNDMHGKMKEEQMYAQNGQMISSTAYHYKVDDDNAETKHLNNNITIADRAGNISNTASIGLDIEMWQDYREERAVSQGVGFSVNTDGWWMVIPVVLGLVQGMLHKQDTRFRSAVTTKYIKRHGLLDKVTKIQDGATITTENILYDGETGNVIATKTQNEFEDPMYHFTYPAHWVYEGMRQASINVGTSIFPVYFNAGKPYTDAAYSTLLPNYQNIFAEGDQVLLLGYPRKWDITVTPTLLTTYVVPGNPDLRFFDKDGNPYTSATRYFAKILRSGRRNMADLPVGELVSKTNPTTFATISAFADDPATQIIEASANTYRDLWTGYCGCTGTIQTSLSSKQSKSGTSAFAASGIYFNPYNQGLKGNWRIDSIIVNHLIRSANTASANTNTRTNGITQNFEPFWNYSGNNWGVNPSKGPGWVRQSTATNYNFKGAQTEERDALGIYSSAHYGYFYNLNTDVVQNARYGQATSDNFEDYLGAFKFLPTADSSCTDMQNLGTFSGFIDAAFAHSGKYGIKTTTNASIYRDFIYRPAPGSIVVNTSGAGTGYSTFTNGCDLSVSLDTGKYVVSVWVNVPGCSTNDNTPKITVKTGPNISSLTTVGTINVASGPVIEGWRRIWGVITIPTTIGSGNLIRISLDPSATAANTYFDDFRIHPFLANMKSFVYDPSSLRLMAGLDENNYATFYEYDEEGMLIRVKRETERGIMTVEEHRNSIHPEPNN